MKIEVPVWLVVLTILVIIALVLIVWSVKRRRRPKFKVEHFGDTSALMQSISGFTQGTVVTGNRIELVQNGKFFEALFAAIDGAKESVSIETFLSKEGKVTSDLADLLAKKSREGVDVRLMLDGSGGRKFGKKALKMIADAGCTVQKYHPIKLSNLGRINNRTHRKIAVIDGRTGFIGGHCFVDSWLGDAQDKKHFRDISARVEGPVVAQLQAAFLDNWMEECGEAAAGEALFPILDDAGTSPAHVVYVSPTGNPSTMKLLHYAAIHAARTRLLIQNPYFLPDPDARDALVDAVKRGVEVKIMLPAASASDSPIVQHASHHHYGTLLEGGVRIFEYQRTLLHQKVLTVDGKWASIGSSNFDDRSFEINDEVALVVYDEAVAGELERVFESDLRECQEQSLESWKRRAVLHKLRDGTAFLFNEQL
jgi:cardiolipin synthase A/B